MKTHHVLTHKDFPVGNYAFTTHSGRDKFISLKTQAVLLDEFENVCDIVDNLDEAREFVRNGFGTAIALDAGDYNSIDHAQRILYYEYEKALDSCDGF